MATRSFHPARLLAFASLLLVLWLVFAEWSAPSPGPLSAVHGREAELASSDGCALCHGEGDRSPADACLACHASITAQRDARSGLHGALDAAVLARCGQCHGEHRGEELELSGHAAFARAGVADPARYDHAHLAFELGGVHASLACKECHPHAETALLPVGEKRYLGLEQRCESCHEDPHEGNLPNCAICHGEERPFVEVAAFEHASSFPLEGSHAGLKCTACHEPGSSRSVETLFQDDFTLPAPRDCAACHPHEHRAEFLSAVVERERLAAPEQSCALCHTARHESFTASNVERARELHAASGFALEAPHAQLECAACHAGKEGAQGFAQRYPGRASRDCAACHGDPHDGQFADGPFARDTCTDCHAATHFAPSRFDTELHARASFALEGKHRAVSCTECHPPAATGVIAERLFSAAPHTCAACHVDPHAGSLDARAGERGCTSCHDLHGFAPSRFDLAAHAATRFALTGAHEQVACSACHPQRAGSTTPGDRVLAGAPTACASCHVDPHGGQFAAVGASTTDCARCHETTSFQRSAFTEEEHARAGFALTGAHRAVSCDRCHTEVATPNGVQRRFRGTPQQCDACHADVHRGRFARAELPRVVEGQSGCARCHDTASFRAVERARFDHALWTDYRLVGQHARATCEQCHAPDPDPRAARRLGLAPNACADCHADPHAGQFRVDGRNDCARCHAESAARFELRASFDHDRDTRFALDASHAKLACSACHVAQPLSEGAKVVRYRPLGQRCEDCHATPKRRGEDGR
ncbi:MAG: hypothetical protein IPN34_16360 [Planctomycetes bacterium]|nr:hypothetical protein [Planctomycetota bacterium]